MRSHKIHETTPADVPASTSPLGFGVMPTWCAYWMDLDASEARAIWVELGHKGYSPARLATREDVDAWNQERGITKAHAEAMLTGSMFGWNCPAANPYNQLDAMDREAEAQEA